MKVPNKRVSKYSLVPYNKGTRVMVFKEEKVVTNFSRVPDGIIERVLKFYNAISRNEVNQHTGDLVYKVTAIVNEQGGQITLFSTASKAKRNRYILKDLVCQAKLS